MGLALILPWLSPAEGTTYQVRVSALGVTALRLDFLLAGTVKSYSCSSMQFRHWPFAVPLRLLPYTAAVSASRSQSISGICGGCAGGEALNLEGNNPHWRCRGSGMGSILNRGFLPLSRLQKGSF